MASESSSVTNVHRIEPLKGEEDYAVWKVQMVDILTDMGLMEFVEGTALVKGAGTPPTEGESSSSRSTEEKASKEQLKKDRVALSAIRLRVSRNLLVYVGSATTSKEAWDTLKEMFESQGTLGIVLARRKMFRAQCDEGTSIEEHIRVMRGYLEELNTLGQKFSDQEFAITLLTSLPESWDTFIDSIDLDTVKSSSKIISRILEQGRRARSRNVNDDTALTGHGKNIKKSTIKCFNCGK